MEKENVIPFNLNIPVTPSPRKHSVDSPSKKRLTGRKSKSGDSPTKSPSRAPIASKISFFERQDGSNTPLPDSLSWHFPEVRDKIELYERMFMGTPMKGQGRRDVVIKHDEWKKMMGELLGQVQEKTEQLKACEDSAAASEGRASSLSEELHSKQENDEMRERVAELEKEAGVLAAQAAQDKHYSQCAEDKVEQLMVELIAEQERGREVEEELESEKERCKQLQEEVDARNAEIDQMAKKLVSRNAELKLYKSKVEHFLGLLETRTSTPNKKRMSICSDSSSSSISSSSSSSSASKKPRPSPAFSCPSPRFDYKFDPSMSTTTSTHKRKRKRKKRKKEKKEKRKTFLFSALPSPLPSPPLPSPLLSSPLLSPLPPPSSSSISGQFSSAHLVISIAPSPSVCPPPSKRKKGKKKKKKKKEKDREEER